MSESPLANFGRQALAALDALADRAFTLPKKGKRPTRASDIVGPRAVADLFNGAVTPSLVLILLALVAIGFVWLISKVGLWLFLAAAWAGILGTLYYLRNRIVMSRVAEAMRRRDEEDSEPPAPPSA